MDSIYSNAINSIELGVKLVEEDRNLITASNAVRLIYSGVLLLFKEKLRLLSPAGSNEILIRSRIDFFINEDGTLQYNGAGNTIDYQQTKTRFENLGIEVNWKAVEKARDFRNNLEHYMVVVENYKIDEIITGLYELIYDFIREELEKEFSNEFSSETVAFFRNTQILFRKEKKELTEKIHSNLDTDFAFYFEHLKCEACNSSLLEFEHKSSNYLIFKCRQCGNISNIEIDDKLKSVISTYSVHRKNWIQLKNNIPNNWKEVLCGEFSKEYFIELDNNLMFLYFSKKIVPSSYLICNALNFTPFNDIKVVILGQEPYHGVDQADGLAFSIKPELPIPPSLSNIFKELYSDLGVIRSSGNLSDWAEQGVLLLNRVLTVEHGMANSHGNLGWKYFTENIIKSVSEKLDSVVFILWGKQAQDCKTFINLSKHMVIEGPHPSPLSAHRGFLGSKPFSATNKYLESKNKNAIKW